MLFCLRVIKFEKYVTLVFCHEIICLIPDVHTVQQFTCCWHVLWHHSMYPLGDRDRNRRRHGRICTRRLRSAILRRCRISFPAAVATAASYATNTTSGGRSRRHGWWSTAGSTVSNGRMDIWDQYQDEEKFIFFFYSKNFNLLRKSGK